MKLLKVIHGYPPQYNAGSEVYSQAVAQQMAKKHQVQVFTREEDTFRPDFAYRTATDEDDQRIRLHLVNNPRLKDRYRDASIDRLFAQIMDETKPDLVHIGHLNHLSTSILQEVAMRNVPLVFTLHDYWLMCPRGQFIQRFPTDHEQVWGLCGGQEDRKCATHCYACYFGGGAQQRKSDIAYWTDWVEQRMQHVHAMAELVDLFIAPSNYLLKRFHTDFSLPLSKLTYLDYGFNHKILKGKRRAANSTFTFGYIGTHIPAKGIHDLLRAFNLVKGDARLVIWGRPRGLDTTALKNLVDTELSERAKKRVQWRTEYRNQDIVGEVFSHCDAIVTPSIWVENSPLVIHEAQQARVPVITADTGGMAEYVHHEVNGLLFRHRDVHSLAKQMQRLADDPSLAEQLGKVGYLYSASGDVPEISEHCRQLEDLYAQTIKKRHRTSVKKRKGPWRITFDTNPDTCNLSCIMCEGFSPYSEVPKKRKAERRPGRIMPFEMIERVVSKAAEHGLREIIPSTMGEPLLYRDFHRILDLCRKYDIKLNLTTNGTFPRQGATAWAEKIVPVTSDVKISWNGANKKTHEIIMVDSTWEEVLGNVRRFIAVRDEYASGGSNRCRVTFQMTFLQTNVTELAGIVKLAAKLGVDRVKGHHLWAHFKEIKNLSMRRSKESIRQWNEAVEEAQTATQKYRLPNGKSVLLDNIFTLSPSAVDELVPDGKCPFLGQEAWISAEGRFNPCCAPDEQRRSLGQFGNLNETADFMSIWNSAEYRQLMHTYQNRTLCQQCNMRQPVKT